MVYVSVRQNACQGIFLYESVRVYVCMEWVCVGVNSLCVRMCVEYLSVYMWYMSMKCGGMDMVGCV